jgi:hypothetical protein
MRKSPEAIRSTELGLAALKDNVIRAADRFSQKHRRNGEEIRRVAGRIESGRQENRQLGWGRPGRAGQVGSPGAQEQESQDYRNSHRPPNPNSVREE